MKLSLNSETVGTSFFAATAGATLARMACAARPSAYRCVLALPVEKSGTCEQGGVKRVRRRDDEGRGQTGDSGASEGLG